MAGAGLSADASAAFGRRVRELRDGQGLTQEQLAERAGITRNHLQLVELGVVNRRTREPMNPRLGTLVGLARALGVRVDIRYVDEQLHVELVSED